MLVFYRVNSFPFQINNFFLLTDAKQMEEDNKIGYLTMTLLNYENGHYFRFSTMKILQT